MSGLTTILKNIGPLIAAIEKNDVDCTKGLKLMQDVDAAYATVRSDKEVRDKAKGIIRDIWAKNPDAELNLKEVTQSAGLKPVPADEAFARGVIKKLRIEYKQAAE